MLKYDIDALKQLISEFAEDMDVATSILDFAQADPSGFYDYFDDLTAVVDALALSDNTKALEWLEDNNLT